MGFSAGSDEEDGEEDDSDADDISEDGSFASVDDLEGTFTFILNC